MIHLRHSVIVQDVQHAKAVSSILFAEDALLWHTASVGIFLKKKTPTVLSRINRNIPLFFSHEPAGFVVSPFS